MKRRKYYVRLVLVTLLISLIPTVAYADDAITDILDNKRFGGMLQWVNWIGGFVDNGFTFFITIAAFTIISVACLKNVLAGVCCTYPKFWEKVHEAHISTNDITVSQAVKYFTDGGYKNTSRGSLTTFIFGHIPDVIVLTEFEDAKDVDYKSYFAVAIPQCFVAVFIGIFIYNGYYRDVMKVTSQFGCEIVTQALSSVHPEEIMYRLTNISGTPSYGVKGVETGTDRIADALVVPMYGAITDDYPDQSEKGNKSNLHNALSNLLSTDFKTKFAEYADEGTWDVVKVTAACDPAPVTQPPDYISEDGMTATIYLQYGINTSGGLTVNSEYLRGEDYVAYGSVQLRNKGASAKGIDGDSVKDFVLTLPASISNNVLIYGDGQSNLRLVSVKNSSASIGGVPVNIDATSIIFKADPSSVIKIGDLIQCKGLMYQSTNSRYNIAGVRFKSDITQGTLYSESTGISISIGDSVEDAYKKLKNSGGLKTNKPESSKDSEEDNSLFEGAD